MSGDSGENAKKLDGSTGSTSIVGGLTDFINTKESDGDYTIVKTANPVNWSRLGQALSLSSLVALSAGFAQIPANWADGFGDIVDGGVAFVGNASEGSGLLGRFAVPILNAYEKDLVEASVAQFGIFGYPVALIITLIILFVFSVGLQRAGSVILGGDG